MTLDAFVRQVPGFSALSHAEKIKLFAWYLHTNRGVAAFRVADIRACYEATYLDGPANLSRSIDALSEKRPPEVLKASGAYRLHANVRHALDQRYGAPESTVVVEAALAELPAKLTSASERLYLEETLTCYRHRAFRAAIVMSWNLAYDHLLHWVLADSTRLAAFNVGIPLRNRKKAHITVASRPDFEELKEDEVIDIVAGLPGITGNMKRTLKEKLGRRNTYAHPSTMSVAKPQVDDMITDLVHNIVLRLP